MPPNTEEPAADPAGKQPANATPDLDALRAEVRAEPEAADEIYTVALCDTKVRVKHYLDWPNEADELFIAGRLTPWAAEILYKDDYATVWKPLKPTNRQVGAFLLALEAEAGIPFVSSVGSQTT